MFEIWDVNDLIVEKDNQLNQTRFVDYYEGATLVSSKKIIMLFEAGDNQKHFFLSFVHFGFAH